MDKHFPAYEAPAIIAVSGGADSLLALALLHDKGKALAAVHGLFLPETPPDAERSRRLAAICRGLDVPFLEIDLRREFAEEIIHPFVRSYLRGRTPNPCALCNPRLKFGLLLRKAAERCNAPDAPFATGHYAGVLTHPAWGAMLARGADAGKDQSYFLSLLPKTTLQRLRFPLAHVSKKDVPEMLAARGLAAPEHGASQEICFIPDNDYRAFLQREAAGLDLRLSGPGPVVLPDGATVGTHQGLWRYTQGQRRGLGIAHSEPLYVLGKDLDANALIVGGAQARTASGCVLEDVNFFVPLQNWPSAVLAQIRYRQKPRPVQVAPHSAGLTLRFLDPLAEAQDGPPAPGQLGVCYTSDGLVLGGGIITSQPLAE